MHRSPAVFLGNVLRLSGLCCVLALPALAAYWGMRHNAFVGFDDGAYIFDNVHVLTGLTPRNLAWAFSELHEMYWHPLTWLSLMLDTELFGLSAAGTHFMSLAMHILNALLLFHILHRTTGRTGPALAAALLFVLHPVNVDSVAWAAERKNVLSTLLLLLSLASWVEYARRGRRGPYLAALAFMLASLMAKPMAVVLPGIMLAMDWWPLNRFPARSGARGDGLPPRPAPMRRLVAEKLPFLAAALAMALFISLTVDTFSVNSGPMPMSMRLETALVGFARYLGLLIWPTDLAILYPIRDPAWWQWSGALLLLAGLSAPIWCLRHRQPWLLAGWCWFLAALAPVSGVARIGLWPAIADRFAYVPFMGLFMALAWAAASLHAGSIRRWRPAGALLPAMGVAVLVVLGLLTAAQVRTWRNTATLFQHALDTGNPSATAHMAMGQQYLDQGDYARAEAHFKATLDINPRYMPALNRLGLLSMRRDEPDRAEGYFQHALQLEPDSAVVLNNLALLRGIQGRTDESMDLFDRAAAADARFASPLANKANVLAERGRLPEAMALYRRALELDPLSPEAHFNYGLHLMAEGDEAQGRAHVQEALRLGSKNPDILLRVGKMLALSRADRQAEMLYRLLLDSHPKNVQAMIELAGLLRRHGRADQARVLLQRALSLAPDNKTIRKTLEDLPPSAAPGKAP